MQWKELESLAIVNECHRALRKQCRGHYYSNYPVFAPALEKEFAQTKMWIAKEGDNMLLLQQYSDFYKLYYFIGDSEKLEVTLPAYTNGKNVLCEVFDEEGREKQTEGLAALKKQGFTQYRKFFMWEFNEHPNADITTPENISFGDSITIGQLKELFGLFDPIVDLIPQEDGYDDYLKSKNFLTCYVDNEYAGCAVYTVKDYQIDEDFVIVDSKFRGLGIGRILENELLKKSFLDLKTKKVVPWIHTDNKRSMGFHTAAGAKRTPYYKVSLLFNNK